MDAELLADLDAAGETKVREPDAETKKCLLGTIHLLCTSKESRQFLRRRRAYPIVRNLDVSLARTLEARLRPWSALAHLSAVHVCVFVTWDAGADGGDSRRGVRSRLRNCEFLGAYWCSGGDVPPLLPPSPLALFKPTHENVCCVVACSRSATRRRETTRRSWVRPARSQQRRRRTGHSGAQRSHPSFGRWTTWTS